MTYPTSSAQHDEIDIDGIDSWPHAHQMSYGKDLGGRIKAAREAKGLTQFELAVAAGSQSATISRYETGGMIPSAEKLALLVAALDAPAGWLLTGGGDADGDSPPYPAWGEFLRDVDRNALHMTDDERACLAAVRVPPGKVPTSLWYVGLLISIRQLNADTASQPQPSTPTVDPSATTRPKA